MRPAPGLAARAGRLVPGLALTGFVAALAIGAGSGAWAQAHGLTPLTWAIVLGMLIGNTCYARCAAVAAPGVGFAKQRLLRIGVVLYGLRLTLQDIAHVGFSGVVVDAVMVGSTFLLAVCAGTRLFGMDRKTSMLIGAGSAICGAAAVMATEPVVRARAEQVTLAIATVVVFGTFAIFLYPLLFRLNVAWHLVPGGSDRFGIYAGSTIHEVAQVIAAGRAIDPAAAATAVVTKMVRVLMLAPFLLLLAAWVAREPSDTPPASTGRARRALVVPWFAFGFIAVVLLNSLARLPAAWVQLALAADTVLLAMAMAALGLTTHIGAVRSAGRQPLLLGLLLAVWLVVGGALVNRCVVALFA